ncbi:hypothetical protein D3C76_1061200 [compost metagenome]
MSSWMRLVRALKRPKHWANAAADTLKMVACRVHTDEKRMVLKNLERDIRFFCRNGMSGDESSNLIKTPKRDINLLFDT